MEAARLAALRGHEVILAEAPTQLGGKLALRGEDLRPERRRPAMAARAESRRCRSMSELNARASMGHGFGALGEAEVVVAALGGDGARPSLPGADATRAHGRRARRMAGAGEPLPGRRVVVLGGAGPGWVWPSAGVRRATR